LETSWLLIFFTMIWGLEWFGTCLYILWRTLWVTDSSDSSDSKTRFPLMSDSYKLKSVKGIKYPITNQYLVQMRKYQLIVERWAEPNMIHEFFIKWKYVKVIRIIIWGTWVSRFKFTVKFQILKDFSLISNIKPYHNNVYCFSYLTCVHSKVISFLHIFSCYLVLSLR